MAQVPKILRLLDLSVIGKLCSGTYNVKNICEGKNLHFYIYLIFSGSWIGPYIPVQFWLETTLSVRPD